ncbi:tetratricopeptide repeat protein [Tundrisphaera sp. TA3]|uniref:tetratricopeptide repeat protein n=1 Tax=Tundrisphaera sp. TA3 TaxID=3435775 RepID=UPI003EBAB139
MIQRSGGNRDNRKPPARGRGGRPAAPGRAAGAGGSRGGASKRGGLGLKRLGGDEFVLVHPKCVDEMELDYEEGIELRKAGDPEAARDALRFALQGCGDNLWVHVALGQIALEDFKDPTLARGHFGYAYELVDRAIPRDFAAKLPHAHPANRPLYDAIKGLIACHEALGDLELARELRERSAPWSRPSSPRRPG